MGPVDRRRAGLGQGFQFQKTWSDYLPPESLQIHNLRAPREDDEGGVTVVAESGAGKQAVVARFDGAGWTAQPAGGKKIRRAWRSGNKASWVMTSDGCSDRRRESGTAEDQMFPPAVLRHGRWNRRHVLAGHLSRLVSLRPPLWRNPHPFLQFNSLVHCLADDDAGRLWLSPPAGCTRSEGETHREFALRNPQRATRSSSARCFRSGRDPVAGRG